jgi:hypothetical protein
LDAEPVEVELATFVEPVGKHRPRHRCRVGQPEVFGDVDDDAEWEVLRFHRHRGVDLENPERAQPQGASAIRMGLLLLLILCTHQRDRYDTTQKTDRQ